MPSAWFYNDSDYHATSAILHLNSWLELLCNHIFIKISEMQSFHRAVRKLVSSQNNVQVWRHDSMDAVTICYDNHDMMMTP